MEIITRNEVCYILLRPLNVAQEYKDHISESLRQMDEDDFMAYYKKITGHTLNKLIRNRYVLD